MDLIFSAVALGVAIGFGGAAILGSAGAATVIAAPMFVKLASKLPRFVQVFKKISEVFDSANKLKITSQENLKKFAAWISPFQKNGTLTTKIDEIKAATDAITPEMIKKSPWLGDSRVGVRAMLMFFKDGGSYLIKKSDYDAFVTVIHQLKIVW
mgnify:CR=1 FL=1